MRSIIRTSQAPIFNVPLVQAVTYGDRVFTAGMVGTNPLTMNRCISFEEQTRQVLDNLISASKAAGMKPQSMLKCTVFLKDMLYADIFNTIFEEYFGDLPIPRTIYAIPKLAGPYEMEVEVFGYKTGSITIEPIITDNAPMPKGSHVQGVKAGNFIYTSSQAPVSPFTGFPEEDFSEQIRLAIRNMIAVVEAGGGSKESIIKNVVFLRDMSKFDDFNPVYGEFFQKENNPPARSCFGVSGLSGISQIEIECVAYIGSDREQLFSPDAPVLDFPFCQGIRAEDLVFISGQVGFDPKTKTVPPTFRGQTKCMMENMLAVAKAAGAQPEDIVKTTCFLTDIGQFDFFNQLYKMYFTHDYPARSAFEVNRLSYEYLVEIDGIACVPFSKLGGKHEF